MERQGCAVIPPFAAAGNQMRDTIGKADRFLRFSGSIAAKYRTAEGDIWKRFTLVFRLQMHGPRQMRNRAGIDRTVLRLRRTLLFLLKQGGNQSLIRDSDVYVKAYAGICVRTYVNLRAGNRAFSKTFLGDDAERFDGKNWNLVLTRLVDCQDLLKIRLVNACQTSVGWHAFEKKSLAGIETCNNERAAADFGVLKNIRYGWNGRRLRGKADLGDGTYWLNKSHGRTEQDGITRTNRISRVYQMPGEKRLSGGQRLSVYRPAAQFWLSGKYARTEIDMITEDFASLKRERGIVLFAGIENRRWIKALLTRMISDKAGHAVPDKAGHAVTPAFFTLKYSVVSTRGLRYGWNSVNHQWLRIIGQAEKHWFERFQKLEKFQTLLISQTTKKVSTIKRTITGFDVYENGKYSIKSGEKIKSLTFHHMTSPNLELLFRKPVKLSGGMMNPALSGTACPALSGTACPALSGTACLTLQNIETINSNRKNFVGKDIKSARLFIRKKAVIQIKNPPVSSFSLKTEIRFLDRKRQGIVLPANNDAISVSYSEKKAQLLITLFLRREVVIHSVQPVIKTHQPPVFIKETKIKSGLSGADNRREVVGTILNKVLWQNGMVRQARNEDSFYRIINKQRDKETGVIVRKNLSYKTVIGNSVLTRREYGKIYLAITAQSAPFFPLPRSCEKVTVTAKTLLKTVKRLFSWFRSVKFGMLMQKNMKTSHEDMHLILAGTACPTLPGIACPALSGTACPALSGTACPALSGITTVRRNRINSEADSVRFVSIFIQKNSVMKKIQLPIIFSILKRDIRLLYRRRQQMISTANNSSRVMYRLEKKGIAPVTQVLQWQVLKNKIDHSAQKHIFYRVTEENFGQLFKENGKGYRVGENHVLRFTARKEFRGIESALLKAVESFFPKIYSVGLESFMIRNLKASRKAEYSVSLHLASPVFFRTVHRTLSITVHPILSGSAYPELSGAARPMLYGVLPFDQKDAFNIFRDVRKQRYLHKIKNISVQKNLWSRKNTLNRRSLQALKDIWNRLNAWKQDNPLRLETTYIQEKNQNRKNDWEQGNSRTSVDIWNYVTGWTQEWILKQRRTQKQGYSGCSENFRAIKGFQWRFYEKKHLNQADSSNQAIYQNQSIYESQTNHRIHKNIRSLFEYRSQASDQSRGDRRRPQGPLSRNYFKNLEFIKKPDPSGQTRDTPNHQLFLYRNDFVRMSKIQPQVSSADFDRIFHLSSELFIKKNERKQYSVHVSHRSPVSRLFTVRTASTREDTVNKADVGNAEALFAETMHERLNPIADHPSYHPSYRPKPLPMVHVMKDRNTKKNSGGGKEADSSVSSNLPASGTGSQQVLTETLSRLEAFSVRQEYENNEERIQLETLQKQVNDQVLQIRELYKTQEALTKQLDRQNSHLDMRLLFQFEEELQMEQQRLGLDMA